MDDLLLRRRVASGSPGTAASIAGYQTGNAFELEEDTMPVILLWGIPTLIVVGGGAFWLIHAHH
jgi:hypothetical protein